MNKKAQKNLKDLSIELQKSEGLVMVLVYSAGIGRMQFKAAFADELDRQDGDDERPHMTYETPWEALRAFADKMEVSLAKEAWEARLDALRGGR
jgi:hypothetical protein